MKKIQVIGWYGEGNLGDEHFRSVFTRALPVPLTFSKVAQPDSDLIIFGGGGVACCAYLNGVGEIQAPKIAVGVDVASAGREWDRLCASGLDKAWIRSKLYLRDITNRPPTPGQPEFHYTPDIAFFDYDLVKRQPKEKTIGVILTQEVMRCPGVVRNLSKSLNFLRVQGFNIEFLSYYRGNNCWDDTATMALGFYDAFKHRELQCYHTDDPVEMVNVLSKYQLLVTMRFHGAIHATMAHTPFLLLGNPGKHSLFCSQEGLSCFYPLDTENLLGPMLRLLSDTKLLSQLEGISIANHAAVTSVFAEVKKYL